MELDIKIIILVVMFSLLIFKTLQIYYIHKNNNNYTFVVRFKSGITHYIDLQENTTKDELIRCAIRISGEEEANIVGIYNVFGDELEYIKGVWVEKWQVKKRKII